MLGRQYFLHLMSYQGSQFNRIPGRNGIPSRTLLILTALNGPDKLQNGFILITGQSAFEYLPFPKSPKDGIQHCIFPMIWFVVTNPREVCGSSLGKESGRFQNKRLWVNWIEVEERSKSAVSKIQNIFFMLKRVGRLVRLGRFAFFSYISEFNQIFQTF